jgi:Xaa-Pro aminopeptidase
MISSHLRLVLAVVVAVTALVGRPSAGPPIFTTAFPPEEFAAHREALLARVGDGLVVVQGAAELPSYQRFRQSNHFFYLSGVEVPRALLVLDGRTRKATLFLASRNAAMERMEGPVLVPGEEAARLTGIAEVLPREDFAEVFARRAPGRIVYTPMRGESLAAGTPDAVSRHAAVTAADPWDHRSSREAAFVEKLKAAVPGADVRDLDPLLDDVRTIKTPREIAAMRASTTVACRAIGESMRAARPGMREHELEAIGDFVFKSAGAQGSAYFALVATGVNAIYPHYHGGTDELKDGDLVLYDYAPDLSYYASDVTRMFPAGGRFSPAQRELYGTYVRLYEALMHAIRPGVAPRDILRTAVRSMEGIVAATSFSHPRYRAAVEEFVDGYRRNSRNSLGHTLGMEAHDVGVTHELLEPGMVFTIEPQLRVPDEQAYVRLEDVILVTKDGYENLSASLPIDIDGIERLMAEPSRFDPPRDAGHAEAIGAICVITKGTDASPVPARLPPWRRRAGRRAG